MAFQTKMVANGGLGQETYLPNGVISSTFVDLCLIRHQCKVLVALPSTSHSCGESGIVLSDRRQLWLGKQLDCPYRTALMGLVTPHSCRCQSLELHAQASTLSRQTSQWRLRARRLRWFYSSPSAKLCGSPTCIPDRYQTELSPSASPVYSQGTRSLAFCTLAWLSCCACNPSHRPITPCRIDVAFFTPRAGYAMSVRQSPLHKPNA